MDQACVHPSRLLSHLRQFILVLLLYLLLLLLLPRLPFTGCLKSIGLNSTIISIIQTTLSSSQPLRPDGTLELPVGPTFIYSTFERRGRWLGCLRSLLALKETQVDVWWRVKVVLSLKALEKRLKWGMWCNKLVQKDILLRIIRDDADKPLIYTTAAQSLTRCSRVFTRFLSSHVFLFFLSFRWN